LELVDVSPLLLRARHVLMRRILIIIVLLQLSGLRVVQLHMMLLLRERQVIWRLCLRMQHMLWSVWQKLHLLSLLWMLREMNGL
jgi:hypothetical protein